MHYFYIHPNLLNQTLAYKLNQNQTETCSNQQQLLLQWFLGYYIVPNLSCTLTRKTLAYSVHFCLCTRYFYIDPKLLNHTLAYKFNQNQTEKCSNQQQVLLQWFLGYYIVPNLSCTLTYSVQFTEKSWRIL